MKAIITFHSIDDSGSVLSFSEERFERLLKSLHQSALPVLNLDDLLADDIKKGVALTFDDGMRSLYNAALPILREYDVPAHLYLTTAAIDKDNRWATQPDDAPGFDMLNWDEIEALHATGVVIDSHTHNHPDMRKISRDEMQEECDMADDLIEQRLGRRPQYFAYPYGYKNNSVSDFVRERYKATVTTELRMLNGHEDVANLPRLDSYYLKNNWLQDNLANTAGRAYLSLRSLMRTMRGTQ
jgi:peptidoglycan/xylan/chitin deacetylase (PgdA/CDA1 family)